MEIERKYLVNKEHWLKLDKPAGEKITQGYLTTDINKTIRVRIRDLIGYISIKGKTNNITREEFEFVIPIEEATELIKKFAEGIIEKIRYTIIYKEQTWEVDEFLGNNEGLLIAEIELKSEDERFKLPDWIDKEVSYDKRYFNSNLSIDPFKSWGNK